MAIGFEKKRVKKDSLREIFAKKRDEMNVKDVVEKSRRVQELFSQLPEYSKAKAIMLYAAMEKEVMTDKAIKDSLSNGKVVALPSIEIETRSMTPVIVSPDSLKNLKPGAYGIMEPEGKKLSKDELDIIVMPVLAFDDEGDRLGRGGIGYYDRFLKGTKALKVGFAFDWQKADEIPRETHDVQLELVVTESRVFDCRPGRKAGNSGEKQNG
ncbi:5-formyltetrahydrofolate cyclo-ligase [Candidatus Woesearchaeota archaeon]|nr:5-formyltetrahydrofolate cyclo-ligase [Candidatus Woesearchaeota archaeon]